MALLFGQRPDWHECLKAVKPTAALVLDRTMFALILSKFPKETAHPPLHPHPCTDVSSSHVYTCTWY